MGNNISKAQTIIDELFFDDKYITQWQWELLHDVIGNVKLTSCPLVESCEIKERYEKELEKSKSSAKKKPFKEIPDASPGDIITDNMK